MPLTMPLPRYLSIPSLDVGAVLESDSAENCKPKSLFRTHRPWAVSHSPALTEGSVPTTVTNSRCPWVFTLRTENPLSSLKKVTRSISPERLSGNEDGRCVHTRSGLWVWVPVLASTSFAAGGTQGAL